MNNEIFKKFIGPYFDVAIADLGGIAKVREQHNMWSMTSFVAGYMCGAIGAVDTVDLGGIVYMPWRDDEPTSLGKLTQEEMRRIFDFVRLRLESESTTS